MGFDLGQIDLAGVSSNDASVVIQVGAQKNEASTCRPAS